MRKGSGVPSVDNHLRIPDKLYQKLVEHKERTKSRSINRVLIKILSEYFNGENVVMEK